MTWEAIGLAPGKPVKPLGTGGLGVQDRAGLWSLVSSAVEAMLVALCEEAVERPRPLYCLYWVVPAQVSALAMVVGHGGLTCIGWPGKGTQCANLVQDFGFCHLSGKSLLPIAFESFVHLLFMQLVTCSVLNRTVLVPHTGR